MGIFNNALFSSFYARCELLQRCCISHQLVNRLHCIWICVVFFKVWFFALLLEFKFTSIKYMLIVSANLWTRKAKRDDWQVWNFLILKDALRWNQIERVTEQILQKQWNYLYLIKCNENQVLIHEWWLQFYNLQDFIQHTYMTFVNTGSSAKTNVGKKTCLPIVQWMQKNAIV